jgi:hypothetical protein
VRFARAVCHTRCHMEQFEKRSEVFLPSLEVLEYSIAKYSRGKTHLNDLFWSTDNASSSF